MQTPPLVSVVIPCFRQAHFLPEALASVFAQTHPAVEAVVVNDGSDDNTDEVARSFLPQIRYVSQANAGLAGARNAGIAAATGEYLLFLDADDLLHERAVEWLLAGMEGRADRLVTGGWRLFTTVRDEPGQRDCFPPAGPPLPRLIHETLTPVHACLCPRRLADRVGGFEPSLRSCEDWDFWLRIVLSGADYATVPHVGAYYRQTAGSMGKNRERMLATRTEVLLRAHATVQRQPEMLAQFGTEFADAALRVRRRLRVQGGRADQVAAVSAMLESLAGAGFHPRLQGKEALLARLLGRDRTDRLVLAWYRRFDRPMYDFLQRGFA